MSATIAAAVGAYLGWKYLDGKYQISYDIGAIRDVLPAKQFMDSVIGTEKTVGHLWTEAVKKYGNKESLVFEGRSLSFNEVDQLANKAANWALSRGLKQGDRVALLLENSIEFFVLFIGMSKIGIITAWINHHLRGKSILHCVTASKSCVLFFTPTLGSHVSEIANELSAANISSYAFGPEESNAGENIYPVVMSQSSAAPSLDHLKGLQNSGVAAFIYTSGTTGLPKAAIMSHQKMYYLGAVFGLGNKLTAEDRLYCVLPLYHSSAALAFMSMMIIGTTFMFKRKFSASTFWKEVHDSKATIFQYIGELCRYLLQQPPSPYDTNHKIRFCIGNGLRPEIWDAFQDRYKIPMLVEFYGSTEGNISFVNKCTIKEERGTVGRQGALLTRIMGNRFVKFDVDRDEVIRGKDGFCIESAPGEPGELLGLINDANPLSKFEGYTDEASNKKKILTDVFVKGDKYFRSGDLLSKDKNGYIRFVDRIGDTFRWKGENVSTTEVAEVLSVFPGIQEANVYGVQIPGKDGRACMAGIVCDDNLDLKKFYKHVNDNLPNYAVPMFLRKLKAVEITGTFKHQKSNLRKEAFDLSTVTDPLYWLNPSTKQYEPFTSDSLNLITSGKAKL